MNDIDLAKKIKKANGNLYLVGGAVRDEIMNIVPEDKDYCITGLSKDEFLDIFPNAKLIGKDFSVFLMDKSQFALARSERKIGKGYKGFEINTSKNISIEQDLKRRDITINAIAKEVLTGKIIDPYGGVEDIKNKKIRHVSDAFLEDPLRVYRVARFAAKLNFNVEKETLDMMRRLKDELIFLTPERIFEELKKALQTSNPSIFFRTLKDANILDIHFKEIYDLIGIPQPEIYHPEGDVFNHTMIVLDKVSQKTDNVSVRFAALVHDLGKAKTPKNILPQHIGHEENGIELIENICNRLKLPNVWKKRGIEVARYHMKAGIFSNMKPFKKAKFINKISKTSIGLENLQYIVDADDMLDRSKSNFAECGKYVLNKVNGETLIRNGITVQNVGKDEFLHKLYEEQAKIISKYESKSVKENNMIKNENVKRMIDQLGNITQEEIDEENSYKRLKEYEPIDLLQALVETDDVDKKEEE